MTRSFVFAFFVLGALQLADAQHSALAANGSSIAGIVVKEPGSQPLKKATIQVIAEDQRVGSNYTATTDSDGHFSIEKVGAGRYRLFVEKTGFVEINGRGRKSEGRLLSVQEGEQLNDLVLRMLPSAVVSGRVVDEDGEPMSGVLVYARKKKPGKASKLETAGAERTNDLGEYRFHGLFPGQYLMVAIPPPDFHDYERQHEKSPEEARTADTRYLTTYFPGTHHSAQASTIRLRTGDEMPVNFILIPARAYRVRGIVTGISAGQKAMVDLIGKAGQSLLQSNDVGPDGEFEVRGVGPGSYVARATVGTDAQTLTARQDITVVAADVDGIKLVPARSFTVSGHLRIEGRPAGAITQYTVNMHSIDATEDSGFFISLDSFEGNAPVDRLGTFQWTNVNPGTYIVQLHGGEDHDNFLKSVTLGGRDVDTGFTAGGPATLDLVVSPKGGTVEGVVLDHDQPAANATVVTVPEEQYRKIPTRFGVSTSDQNGRFTIRGLTPGSYSVFAWQDIGNDLYYDADFVKSQESNATPLKVEEGSRQKMDVKLSAIAEEWQ
jgi:hypothetical protein